MFDLEQRVAHTCDISQHGLGGLQTQGWGGITMVIVRSVAVRFVAVS